MDRAKHHKDRFVVEEDPALWIPGELYSGLDMTSEVDVAELRRRQLVRSEQIAVVVKQANLPPTERVVAGQRLLWRYCDARPAQVWPEGNDTDLLMLNAGRGAGKNRTASEELFGWASDIPESRWFAAGPTRDQCARTQFTGDSGLLSVVPVVAMKDQSAERAFNKSALQLTLWNGSTIAGFSSERPSSPRGENFYGGWIDEPASLRDSNRLPTDIDTFFSNLALATRAGVDSAWSPRIICTGTPAPVRLLAGEDSADGHRPGLLTGYDELRVTVVRMSSKENIANLPSVYRRLMESLEGTRIGRQEIEAELLSDREGAVWKLPWIVTSPIEQVYPLDEHGQSTFPGWAAKCVAIDHAVSANDDSDETGIVVAALDRNMLYWVLDDKSGRYSPGEWTALTRFLFDEHKCDKVIIERNQGGDLIVTQLEQENFRALDLHQEFVDRSKLRRSQPVALLYEPSGKYPEGRVRHASSFPLLVNQMLDFTGQAGTLDDRVDALMHALTWLMQFDRGSAEFGDLSGLLNRGSRRL